ncbi:MAG: hypothetical protein JJT96_04470 [Opitutales bacterium]|nr:hypothetical protein [Opitutales bacterium]
MNKHPVSALLFGTLAMALGSLSASAEEYLVYSEDFSAYALDTALTNASPLTTWWTPNWNNGDVVQATVSTTGPDGVRAFTRSTQVIAGRFYGGGIRGDTRAFEIPANASSNPEDVTLSLWIKGTSSQSRGPVGISVISKDEANANTGAVYHLLPIVPGEWTEISIPFAEMQDGIPNIAPADTGFDFSSPKLQVFIWMRTDYEDGWPFQEDENHTYSVSIADVRITTTLSADPDPDPDPDPEPTHWGEFEIVDGWVNTGDWLGLLYVGFAPWVYSMDLHAFIFVPEEPSEEGVWTYFVR